MVQESPLDNDKQEVRQVCMKSSAGNRYAGFSELEEFLSGVWLSWLFCWEKCYVEQTVHFLLVLSPVTLIHISEGRVLCCYSNNSLSSSS